MTQKVTKQRQNALNKILKHKENQRQEGHEEHVINKDAFGKSFENDDENNKSNLHHRYNDKRDQQTNMRTPHNFLDFITLSPESFHQLTIVMSDRGPLSVNPDCRCIQNKFEVTLQIHCSHKLIDNYLKARN